MFFLGGHFWAGFVREPPQARAQAHKTRGLGFKFRVQSLGNPSCRTQQVGAKARKKIDQDRSGSMARAVAPRFPPPGREEDLLEF